MITAELNGKRLPAALEREDYLTSAIFGHLRHQEVLGFWLPLFSKARTIDGHSANELISPGAESLRCKVTFWPELGGCFPDLLLTFFSSHMVILRAYIEIKHRSSKSGRGSFEKDQIAKYIFRMKSAEDSKSSILIYLTGVPVRKDLVESLSWFEGDRHKSASESLFYLTWQDVQEVAQTSACTHRSEEDFAQKELLAEVAQFLLHIGYACFDGMRPLDYQISPVLPLWKTPDSV